MIWIRARIDFLSTPLCCAYASQRNYTTCLFTTPNTERQ